MKRLVMIPGKMNRVFFLNEISYFKEKFDNILVLCYRQPSEDLLQIAREYDLEFEIIDSFTLKSILKSILILLRNKNGVITKEISIICHGKEHIFHKLAYMFMYLNFGINAYSLYSKHENSRYEDVIYSFWFSRPAFAAAYIHNRKPEIQAVSRAHGYDLYEEVNDYSYLPFRNYIIKSLSNLYCISEYGVDYCVKHYGILRSNFLQLSHLGTENKERINKRIINKQSVCIVSCATISRNKRLDLIIDVISKITKYKVHWIHIGDGEMLDDMKQYAEKKLFCTYEFLGRVDNSKILDLYASYDVDFIINLSDSEGIPVSIMEAMSMGIPAIARRVGGISEIINQDNGLLLPTDFNLDRDFSEIEKFISLRIDDIKKYSNYSLNAIKYWSNNFNAETNYREIVSRIYSL